MKQINTLMIWLNACFFIFNLISLLVSLILAFYISDAACKFWAIGFGVGTSCMLGACGITALRLNKQYKADS